LPDDPVEFKQQVTQVCQLHQQALELYRQGIHLISTDEMTGIQALEPAHETLPMKPGRVERKEFEYIRQGTQSLIANWHVALGQVITPSIGSSRTEADFTAHINQTIDTDPEAGWIFIVDQLNIHKSESLVHVVAERCKVAIDLGVKGRFGILESMTTRAAFLADSTHRIRFVYIPKHTSWLNQIECWFSILVRRLLKRASFTSVEDLRNRILAFIDYFNCTMAKPFQWKFKGYPVAD
jgi:transposase